MMTQGQGHSLTFDQGHSDSLFSNFFSSHKNAKPFEAKFHMAPPWDEWIKLCSNVPGHMTKMASRPVYSKNLQKSPTLQPRGWWPWNLVYSIGYSNITRFVQIMTLGWLWPFLQHGPVCFPVLLHRWKFIQHIVMYFQACSISAYPMHSSERYTTSGPLVLRNLFILPFMTYDMILHFCR